MPVPYVNKLVKEGKGSKVELEKKWEEAKSKAEEEGKGDNYAYITAIFKKMAKIEPAKKESMAELMYRMRGEGRLCKEAAVALGGTPNPSIGSGFGLGFPGTNQSLVGGPTPVQATNVASGDPGSLSTSPSMVDAGNFREAGMASNVTHQSMGMEANRSPKEESPIRSERDIENQYIPDPEAAQAAND